MRRTPITSVVTLFTLSAMLLAFLPATADAPAAFANLEPAQTNPIRLSADYKRLFAVNSANNSLSVFDVTQPASPVLLLEIPVGLGPVSVNSRSDDEVWVVNQVSNSISVVSVSHGIVMDTLYTGPGSEPMDVVFPADGHAYVSCSRSNAIEVFNANTRALLSTVPVFGGNPRALAVSNDGNTVYAAFALSGNATTIIPAKYAPPQPPPENKQLPPPPQVSLIVAATDPTWSKYIKFKMPDNDVVAIQTGAAPAVSGYYSGVGTINLGIAVNPVTGDLYVSNTDALNLTFYLQNLRGHWINSRITQIQVATGQITPYDLNPTINYGILPNPQAVSIALSQPTSVVFDPSGTFMYLASFGTDRVAKVDTGGNVLGFVEVALPSGQGPNADPKNKRGPRGLALNAPAQTLYALNRIANTIAIIDTASFVESSEISVGTDLTPTYIKQGRGFLYDAKLSGNGTGACASCHIDADFDHLAWNLGDLDGNMTSITELGHTFQFHPMKGPMTTLTLRGLLNLFPYHWRGDQPNFAAFDASFSDLMGGSEISISDMNIYTSFVNSLLFLPNPNQRLDRTLPKVLDNGSPLRGQKIFRNVRDTVHNLTCNNCHTDPGPGSDRLVVPFVPQVMKVPELRNIYQKQLYTNTAPESIDGFGMDHDGIISNMSQFFATSVFQYSQRDESDIGVYMLCFDTGTAPAVGYTITLNALNVNGGTQQEAWTTLQSQAAVPNIDLIARGTIQGQVHGLLYQPSQQNYLSDTGSVYTQAQLTSFILDGDILSFMGVYPGTGTP